ncbi:MAG: hypothetical protein J6F33_12805, partial [Acidaminococcaceae bacterium]|nr:hypothetical protein [Acidaminococcaceae bacterium]
NVGQVVALPDNGQTDASGYSTYQTFFVFHKNYSLLKAGRPDLKQLTTVYFTFILMGGQAFFISAAAPRKLPPLLPPPL